MNKKLISIIENDEKIEIGGHEFIIESYEFNKELIPKPKDYGDLSETDCDDYWDGREEITLTLKSVK